MQQQHCFWNSGRGTALHMSVSGRFLTGAKRRYHHFSFLLWICISVRASITFALLVCFQLTIGGADPRNCQQRQLWAQKVQALLPAQHSGPDLRHRHGGSRFHALPVLIWTLRHVSAITGEDSRARFCFLFQILVIIGLTHALVVFRVIAAVLLAEGSWEFLSNHSNTGAMMLGAVVHYLIITVMTRVWGQRQLLWLLLVASFCDSDLVFVSAD